MGRKVVVELVCDRCRKVEHVAADAQDPQSKSTTFMCTFMGNTVTYGDLCTGCKEVVATHFADITRDMKKVTPRRSNETRQKAMAKVTAKVTGAAPAASTPPPTPAVVQKPAPSGLGEKKTDSHGPSQRP